jgi:outer membrane protein TolC
MKRQAMTTRIQLLTGALAIQIFFPFEVFCAAGKELPELTRPLSKVDALNLALANNGTIREARKDVEAAAGIAIQTRAILFPTLHSSASYAVRQDSLIEANRATAQSHRRKVECSGDPWNRLRRDNGFLWRREVAER